MVEEHFGPFGQSVLSFVEVSSLMQSSSPLDELLLSWSTTTFSISFGLSELTLPICTAGTNFLGLIEEAIVRRLELLIIWIGFGPVACWLSGHDTEAVDSVRMVEKSVLSWLVGNVLPSRVRPSAWNHNQLLLWKTNLFLPELNLRQALS